MKNGKCEDSSCKLQHITDIDSMSKGSEKTYNRTVTIKKPEAEKTKEKEALSSISIISDSSSIFEGHVRRANAAKHAEEKKKKAKEEEDKKKKGIPCRFLFEKGSCRMGDKCFYSHEAPSIAAPRGGRRGERGGRGPMGRPATAVAPRDSSSDSSGMPSRGGRGGLRGGFGGGHASTRGGDFNPGTSYNEPAKMITLKKKNSDEDPVDITDLDSQVRRIYADLIRLEPLRRAMGSGKTLDMMFIIDCTGSMGSWINACKQEIRAIIDCVRNQHFNIKIRVSIVAYRDHCDGDMISEVFGFSDNIEACQKFLKNLDATGGGDLPEDVAGGFENALKQDWQAKSRYAIFIADAPCHGNQYHDCGHDSHPQGDPKGRLIER
jgi:hypothetical protein